MDPLSLTLGCITLVPSIVKATNSTANFILEVRDARKEMDMVTNELNQLKSVLIILDDDTKQCPQDAFPAFLVDQVKIIVRKCQSTITDVENVIRRHDGDSKTKEMKWVSFGRNAMETLRKNLEAYKSGLEIAMGTLHMAMTKVIKADTDKIRDDTAAMKRDTAQILQEIVKLKGELEEKLPNTGSLFIMQRFLGSLTTYAESSRGDGSTGEMGEELHIPTQLEHYIPPIGFLDSSQSGSSPTLASQTHYDAMSISTPSLSQASSLLDIEIIMPPDLSLLSFDDLEKKSNSGVPKFQGVADPFTISDLQYFTEGHADLVYALCRVGSLVISGSRDTSIRIWDTRSGRLRHQPLSGHRGSVHCVIADETRDLLVSGDNKGRIISWKLSTGALQQDFPKAHESCVVGVALNKRYLVSASHDRTAKVWDRNTLLAHEEGGKSDISPKKVLRCHTSAILALVLTEEKAITAGNDCRIRVFDLDSGACLKTISSHKNFIATLALCQDKRHVISAGEDRYILIHDIESGDLVAKLEGGHRDIVRTLLVVPSSTIFISGSYDETVVIWAQNEDGNWKQERVLDVPKAQRSLGLDKLVRQRGYDLTESLRNAAEAGKDAGVFSDSKVFALCSNGRQILCGAGSTILGWDFDDTAVSGIGSRTRNVSPRAFSTTFEGKEAG